MTDAVVRMPESAGGERVQRMCPECEEEFQRQPVEEPEPDEEPE